ncbi:MAG: hypothetical protein RLQ12_10185, partial [Cyclobacteriaceae bacterium]
MKRSSLGKLQILVVFLFLSLFSQSNIYGQTQVRFDQLGFSHSETFNSILIDGYPINISPDLYYDSNHNGARLTSPSTVSFKIGDGSNIDFVSFNYKNDETSISFINIKAFRDGIELFNQTQNTTQLATPTQVALSFEFQNIDELVITGITNPSRFSLEALEIKPPTVPDSDADGFPDDIDLCPDTPSSQADTDADGYGDECDCELANAAINPGTIWYADADGDGFGNPDQTTTSCTQPSGFVSDA